VIDSAHFPWKAPVYEVCIEFTKEMMEQVLSHCVELNTVGVYAMEVLSYETNK
jgi:hypothetical protein